MLPSLLHIVLQHFFYPCFKLQFAGSRGKEQRDSCQGKGRGRYRETEIGHGRQEKDPERVRQKAEASHNATKNVSPSFFSILAVHLFMLLSHFDFLFFFPLFFPPFQRYIILTSTLILPSAG